MQKILFTIPVLGLRIHGFSVMLLLACFGALGLTAWRARRERLDPEAVYGLATWLFSGGFVGARVMYIAMHPETVRSLGDLFKVWQGGIVFYGCILGGLAGSVLYWRRHQFPFLPMADAVAPALAVGILLGRLGCFLNGCCFGAVADLPWALRFPWGSPAWLLHVHQGLISAEASRSLAVHPTQLYAALDGLVLLGLLTWFFPRRRRDGEVMALLMVTYPVMRFFNESLRADEGAVFLGLSVAQVVSVALFVCGLATWAHLARRPATRYADASSSTLPDPHSISRPGSTILFGSRKV